MKSIIVFFVSLFFAFGASAYSVGSSATGPLVNCEFQDGSVKYIPILICKHSEGKVIR
ncbi:hypothetical protein [Vibrio sinensis]|uniref:hypothetical protein n=1 Tax=Vibrio sinensis TaxID=2302434 RepID=UPI001402EEAB|nr:hypothetical protein [Vibrio sinensis]